MDLLLNHLSTLKGHEEYHISHSFFFTSGCIYLLIFDCSLDFEEIVPKNKILYWLNFVESQIGSKTSVILVATKSDLIKKSPEEKKVHFEKINKGKKKFLLLFILFYFILLIILIFYFF